MPKEATGAVRWFNGVASARIRVKGRGRVTFEMPQATSKPEAKERARVLAMLAKRMGGAQISADLACKALEKVATAAERSLRNAIAVAEEVIGGEVQLSAVCDTPTFQQIGERWTKGELAKEYPDQIRVKRSVDDDKSRLTMYVYPVIGSKRIDQVSLEDCEEVMRRLPPELAVLSRRNIGQPMVRIFNMAVFPLKLIRVSPIPDGFLPPPPRQKARGHLYPDEEARLLSCTKLPLVYRMLWGFLAREGMRDSEAILTDWNDVDLTRGAVRLDDNKTNDPRAWALNAGVVEALRAYRERYRTTATATDPLFVNARGRRLSRFGLAELLREHLKAIGLDVERPELFEKTDQRINMQAHDLRGTFVTIHLANGKSESWIADRTGHRSSDMIARYKRKARTFEELRVGELVPLNEAIPELRSPPQIPGIGPSITRGTGILEPSPGIEPGTYGLRNPNGPAESAQIAAFPQDREGAGMPMHALSGATGHSRAIGDQVEAALAEAIAKAAAAGEWRVVEMLAAELKARRDAVAGVVELDAERRRRGR
jgi:integrase